MSEIFLHIKTSKLGSEVKASTGYSADEWAELADADRLQIMNEIVWEKIEVWESEE